MHTSALKNRLAQKTKSGKAFTQGNVGIGGRGSPNNTDSLGVYSGMGAGQEAAGPFPLPAPGYRDLDAKSATDASGDSSEPSTTSCSRYVILAECASGQHHFAKRVYCGREWCEICRKNESAAHKRRQARLFPKLRQIASMGYFVIEFPRFYRQLGQGGLHPDVDQGELVRGWCYSKEDLRETTNTVVNVLAGKRCGRRGRVGGFFGRGLIRWHWFGDKGRGWNPHLNVLVDAAHLERERLEEVKAALRDALNCPDLIVNYSFKPTPGKMVHAMRYVTRATFTNYGWSPYMADQLWNFRNIRWWGSWKDEPVWGQDQVQGEDLSGLEAVSNLQSALCPDCGQPFKVLRHNHDGKPVRWTRAVDSVYLMLWSAEEVAGSGYYRIPHREFTGHGFSPAELLRLEERQTESRASPSVSLKARAARKHVARILAGKEESEQYWARLMEEATEFLSNRQ